MPVQQPLVRVAPAVALLRYLGERGCQVKELCDVAGLSADDLSDPMNFVPLRTVATLFNEATRVTNDCAMSISFGEAVGLGVTGLFGYLANSAPTVREFLRALAGFSPLFATGFNAGFVEQGKRGELYWSTPSGFDVPLKSSNLFVMTCLVTRVRAAVGPSWVPLAVDFEHRAPDRAGDRLAIFGPRLRFNRHVTRIVFDSATLARPLPTANADMFAIFCNHAELLLKQLQAEQDIVSQVSGIVASKLHEPACNLEIVARDMRITSRSLQRRLEHAGTSFEKVLDETRHRIAERLLRDTDRTLTEIAFDLGYSSQSTFTRAARRWFALPPRVYRQQHRLTRQPKQVFAARLPGQSHRDS
ncbi:MAG: AraC family transcriptional regulator [Hyphomicrobiaceae bacterium]|nr:AraC family transcriptional regulator [Hyphomicrobiaceae bacterium]